MFSMSEIGKRVKELRDARGLTQQAVANYCKVSRVAVTKWENGDTENMKFSNITRLLNLFQISYDELTTGKKTTQAESAALLINSLPTDHAKNFALHVLRVEVAKLQAGFSEETQIPSVLIEPLHEQE